MIADRSWEILAEAASSRRPVAGLTHNFYRYPARFSPEFCATAIDLFSKSSDVVYDPYMGGGTTILEAMASGRQAIGSDVNSLAVFVAKVKTTVLSKIEREAVRDWAEQFIPQLMYNRPLPPTCPLAQGPYTRNLNVSRARFTKKVLAIALSTLCDLPSDNSRMFIRCALLRTAQWALDGRRTQASLSLFRQRLDYHIADMLNGLTQLEESLSSLAGNGKKPILIQGDAASIRSNPFFADGSPHVDLVVTSPPYPGLHVLYHRWQVDGRKETPAPYWIIDCPDGQGESHYNFGSRGQKSLQSYFAKSLATLRAVRMAMRPGAYMIQMVAFADVEQYLPPYLANMAAAGFEEVGAVKNDPAVSEDRIWRDVPNRKWHAVLKGKTPGSREVVLIHRAV